MDDWGVLAASRWHLRQAIRVVNQHLTRLKLRQHSDTTWIGRATHGCDCLAYHLTPGGLVPAVTTLHHGRARMLQLYEHGARRPRMGLYLQHWWRWVMAGSAWFTDICRLACGSQQPST